MRCESEKALRWFASYSDEEEGDGFTDEEEHEEERVERVADDKAQRWAAPILAAATRLSWLAVDTVVLEAPPPLLSDGRGALFAYLEARVRDYDARSLVMADDHVFNAGGRHILAAEDTRADMDAYRRAYETVLRLHRGLADAAAAPGGAGPITLVALDDLMQPWDRTGAQIAAEFGCGASLTRLRLYAESPTDAAAARLRTPGSASDRLSSLVSSLRALTDLHILVAPTDAAVALDLRGVDTPPAGLTRLVVGPTEGRGDVLLPPSLAAGLAALEVEYESPDHPPRCLHGAGGAFRCLTRLVYGDHMEYEVYDERKPAQPVNLAPWGHAAWALPSLTDMEIYGQEFTIKNYVGADWATDVATVTLPRLARLRLRTLWVNPRKGFRDFPGRNRVKKDVTVRLPAAAAAAGRDLVVQFDGDWRARRETAMATRRAYFDRAGEFQGLGMAYAKAEG
jgi:hypothetical protein